MAATQPTASFDVVCASVSHDDDGAKRLLIRALGATPSTFRFSGGLARQIGRDLQSAPVPTEKRAPRGKRSIA